MATFKSLNYAVTGSAAAVGLDDTKTNVVLSIIMHNYHTAQETVNVWLDSDGSTYDDTSIIVGDTDGVINPDESLTLDSKLVVPASGHLAINAGGASHVIATINYVEID